LKTLLYFIKRMKSSRQLSCESNKITLIIIIIIIIIIIRVIRFKKFIIRL